jgi:integrase
LPRKKRNAENAGLPNRWRILHGAYYYRVPPGQEHWWDDKKQYRLGKTLAEAHEVFSGKIAQQQGVIQNFSQLIDRYLVEVTPKKAPKTRHDEVYTMGRLRQYIGHNLVRNFLPVNAYQLRDHIQREAKRGSGETTANRHMEKVSHLLTKAIEWGVINSHPMIEGKFRKLPVDNTVEIPEYDYVIEAIKCAPPLVQCYVRLKLLTGMRQTDLLQLTWGNVEERGLIIRHHKTEKHNKKNYLFVMTPELQRVLDDIKQLKPRSLYFFHNRRGEPYRKPDGTCSAFKSMWQRWEKKLEHPFTERSLRNLVGSNIGTLEDAQQTLGHKSAATTARYYRLNPNKITPFTFEE